MQRRQFLKNSLLLSFGSALPWPGLAAADLPADLTSLSATGLSLAIRDGHASCVEVMQAYLRHIHTYNPVYNAIVSLVDDDELIRQANAADQALSRAEYWGWMHGLPHAAKDLTAVAGLTFTSGSAVYADRIAQTDSRLVASVREAGAIFIGKTNAPEFGLGSQTYNSVFGATGSAYDPALTAGGSSGGAASGLGTHMLPVADGSDMMGSLRNPAAFNNVIGFRPSVNVMTSDVSTTRGLSTSGPMGRNVSDVIRFLETIAVQPVPDSYTPLDLKSANIAWLGNLNSYLPMEAGVIDLCQRSLSTIVDAGGNIEAVNPNFTMSDLWQCWTTLRHSGRTSLKPLYDNPDSRSKIKPELIWEIEQSMVLTADDVTAANAIRENWYAELERLFSTYDFLAIPSSQVFPFPKTIHWPQQINGVEMDTYHRWMEVVVPGSLGGIPVINVPVGFDDSGRPMGMQIMGNFGEDKKVLEFGLAYEQISDHLSRQADLVRP